MSPTTREVDAHRAERQRRRAAVRDRALKAGPPCGVCGLPTSAALNETTHPACFAVDLGGAQ